MANARFLTSFAVASGANDLVVTANATQETLTLAAGTYYWSLDNDTTAGQLDIGKALEDLLVTHTQIGACTIKLIGVDQTDATKADGRVYIDCDVDFSLDFSSGTFDLPKDILGWSSSESSDKSSTSTVLTSDFVHRYGWYPQIDALEDIGTTTAMRLFDESTEGYVDTVDYGERDRVRLGFDLRSPALVRILAAQNATNATNVKTTQNDPNIAFERWALDSGNSSRKWRFYPDLTDTSTFRGPFRFPRGPLWTTPLEGPARISQAAGEYWDVSIAGDEAVG